jgi:hypothetical protein
MSEMTIALWELHDASYVEEHAYGTTPSSPSMKSLWHNTISLEPKRDTLRSERRLGDRTRALSRLGFKRCEGNADCELTAGNHDDLLEALFFGRFVTTLFTQISESTISAVASGQTIDDSGSNLGDIEVGDWIIVAGFSAGNNNGVFHVSAASAGSITVEWGSTLTDEGPTTVTIDQQNRLEANNQWPTEGPFTDITADTIAAVNSSSQFTDSGSGFGDIAIGDWVVTSQFSNAANNGIFEVTDAAAGYIEVDGTLTDESAGTDRTVKQKIYRSYTVEGRYVDQSLYHRFLGIMVKNGNFNLTPENIVTCSFGLLGNDFDPQTTSLDTTPTVPSSASLEPFDCLGGTFTEGGTATQKMTSFQLTVENNNNLPKALGIDTALEQSVGAIDMTGTIGFYLTSNALISKFYDETITEIEVTLQDPDANTYTLGFPYVKIMDVDLKKSGDIEAMVNFTLEIGKDPTTGVMAYIVKA